MTMDKRFGFTKVTILLELLILLDFVWTYLVLKWRQSQPQRTPCRKN